ncbi:unnamed protein product [Somion occarium]|uniref:Uncharacterized protein n=1 Tax=Somion occarium TaxID=3059160 RepID=A0ABP1D050_9APHY
MTNAVATNVDSKEIRRSARARRRTAQLAPADTDIFRPSSYNTPDLVHEPAGPIDYKPKPKTRINIGKRKAQAADLSGPELVAKRPRHQRYQQVQASQDPLSSSPSSSKRHGTTTTLGSASSTLVSPRPSEAKEILRRARETIRLNSKSPGHPPFLMDTVLNSQAPNTANLEELLTEALDHKLGRSFHPDAAHYRNDYWTNEPYLWRGVAVEPLDLSPRKIYHVSAERSTASWDSTLDGEDSHDRVLEGRRCTYECDCGYACSSRSSPRGFSLAK